MGSPGKLQRSIRNQTAPSSRCDGDLAISLRNLSISQPPPLPSSLSSTQSKLLSEILILTQPCSATITKLDLTYSRLSPQHLAMLCSTCRSLLCLIAVDCGLSTTEPHMQWPPLLHDIDFSRNKLCKIPHGIEHLLYLKRLNLSGNRINTVTHALLKLPNLKHLYLLRNPIQNIPREVCLEGVEAMREFLQVEPLSAPTSPPVNRAVRRLSLEDGRNSLRNRVLRQRIESLESGYDSGSRLSSIANMYISDSDQEPDLGNRDDPLPDTWPDFCPASLPQDYNETTTCHPLCHLYLPPSASTPHVQIAEVKDLSLHPQLARNELLLTPVVQISPHGLRFDKDEPAIVVLCHCTEPGGVEGEVASVFCSDTGPHQLPQWSKLCGETCTMFKRHVKFFTTHFSMFAVVSTLPYHSTQVVISSNEGGSLSLPAECPGFKVTLPEGCLMPGSAEETITATVYYADSPCANDRDAALASPVVGLEPNGIAFSQPVEVTLPIPNYTAIRNALPDVRLQLWTAPPDGQCWNHLTDTPLTVDCTGQIHTVTFPILHFTLFELLWDTCRDTLLRLRYGVETVYHGLRARPVVVRCQVFMTPPQQDFSFALLVLVYKYGGPLNAMANYPWMLADSGSSRVCLRTGEVEAVLHGFIAVEEHGESPSLSQRQTFTGEDFDLHFDFSLRLRSHHLPLTDYQTIGKLKLKQGNGNTVLELTLIKPPSTTREEPTTPTHTTGTDRPPRNDIRDVPELMTPPPTREHRPRDMEHRPPSATREHRTRADKRRTYLPPRQSKRTLFMRHDNDSIDDQLLMDIAKSVGSKYLELGISLGLPAVTVNSVAGCAEGQGEHMKAFYVLQEWKRVAAENLTFDTLGNALEEAGLNTCAYNTCYTRPLESDTEEF